MSWPQRLLSAEEGAQCASGDGPAAVPTYPVPGEGRGDIRPGKGVLGKAGLRLPDTSAEPSLKIFILPISHMSLRSREG